MGTEQIFDGKKTFIDLSAIPYAQTEGICFLGNDSILISCERTLVTKEQVFLIDLKTLE